MVRQVDAQRRMPPAALAAAVALGLGIAGCGGGDDDFANDPRPAASITLSAAISPGRVTVSPARFGAGPVELIASNQTSISQRLTLRSSRVGRPGQALRQTTGPINPGDTASLKADLAAGDYLVTARSATIDPARIIVGPRRPGSRDELLQP
jgi:hypothetical protein